MMANPGTFTVGMAISLTLVNMFLYVVNASKWTLFTTATYRTQTSATPVEALCELAL